MSAVMAPDVVESRRPLPAVPFAVPLKPEASMVPDVAKARMPFWLPVALPLKVFSEMSPVVTTWVKMPLAPVLCAVPLKPERSILPALVWAKMAFWPAVAPPLKSRMLTCWMSVHCQQELTGYGCKLQQASWYGSS